MSANRADLLAAVERSPQAAGAHDREAWVGLFATDGVIEDPVGSRPHRGRAAIARFYDTFIAPRDITFHRDADFVAGSTVVRDLTLEVRMGSAVTMTIPAYLRYDFDETLSIVRLQAFWELPAMTRQFVRNGRGAVPAGFGLVLALLGNQGPAGTAGFLAGFAGAATRGKHHLAGLLDDACAGDQVAVKRRLGDAATLTRDAGARIGTTEVVALLHGCRWDGMIRAGRTVVARARRDGRRVLVFGDLEMRPTHFRALHVFADDQPT
jgi:SnoaL-like domain